MVATTDKVLENFYRRQAKRLGLELQKSNAKKWHLDNQCGYRVYDPFTPNVILGIKWELDLDDVKQVLDEYEKQVQNGTNLKK